MTLVLAKTLRDDHHSFLMIRELRQRKTKNKGCYAIDCNTNIAIDDHKLLSIRPLWPSSAATAPHCAPPLFNPIAVCFLTFKENNDVAGTV